MAELAFDATGERYFETGVNKCVLYPMDESGAYPLGVAWNGITAVTESPSGAEATPLYADNIKYLNLVSAEEFAATIEAFTYPDEWASCDGSAEPETGVRIGQQPRSQFGLSYKTIIGNDASPDYGYKLHLVYGCLAAPSEKGFATINDAPEAITFSWEVKTTPVAVTDYKPTSVIVIDSTKVAEEDLAVLEAALYGVTGEGQADTDPYLPLPDAVIAMFGGS
jgi:hypothetical protein